MKQASKAIIYYKQQYLLQLRDDNPDIPYPNCWSFFGGEIGDSETPWEALQRELQEELNWYPNHGNFLYKNIDSKSNCCNHIFAVPFEDNQNDLILREGQALQWFVSKEIQKNKNFAPNIKNHMVNFNNTRNKN